MSDQILEKKAIEEFQKWYDKHFDENMKKETEHIYDLLLSSYKAGYLSN